ncbi:MAG: anti-ECFsigma factor, ChrR [Acidobacteriales bacterium]|nr:anti-ECFsigma factor, ChrR [Terriglobales bacterium]
MFTRRIVIACLLLCSFALGQTAAAKKGTAKKSETSKAAPAKKMVWNPDELQWGAPPPFVPLGAQLAVLQGDPSKTGLYTVRLKVPDGYKIPPHWHPTAENVTVISGTLKVGMGAKWDETNATVINTGGFASVPARMKHFAWSAGETVIQIHGMGPLMINYVNPADNPVQPKKDATAK